MATTLVVTNDFPPRIGGIESFVADLCRLLDFDVIVFTSSAPGAADHDADLPFAVVRVPGPLLPTRRVGRQATEILRGSGATRVLFGAAAPLALLTPTLRTAGAERVVALTHGHETWWAAVPGPRRLLRRIGDSVDHVTAISAFTAARIAPALTAEARGRMVRLPPPVDPTAFRPAPARPVGGPPCCVSVCRLVAQKGGDRLLRAWRLVLTDWPASDPPRLVVVGDGPQRSRLHSLAARLRLGESVSFRGPLTRPAVAAELQQADVFALPVRTRLAGLNPEGLGLAALEAAASGLPVIVGNSGGAAETVRDGTTGFVVDADDPDEIADRMSRLLQDPARARRMGTAGRAFVQERYGSAAARATLRTALALT